MTDLFFRALVWLWFLPAISTLAVADPPEVHEPVPETWRTVAEMTDYQATATYEETLAFLERLELRFPQMKVSSFGISPQGRPMPLVVVSKDGFFDPRQARASSLPIVMIQSGIHAGEIDGKDASLEILRDWALGRNLDLLDGTILLFLPIYNVDGHERISPYNRANQNGPRRGMGFRTTAQGLDLNRDHMKLDSPEARAMVSVFNSWRPHLHVDNHVTNGSDHDWVLTYLYPTAPAIDADLSHWLEENLPQVFSRVAGLGHKNGPYVSYKDRLDPGKGFSTWLGGPRYSTGYFALRNRPSLLVEMHSYKPYRQRVAANKALLVELIRQVGRRGKALVRAARSADARVVRLGAMDAEPSRMIIRWAESDEADTITFPVYEWYRAPSFVSGGEILRYRRGRLATIDVPWYHKSVPAKVVSRPRGYFVEAGWPKIEQRLRAHGVVVRRLDEEIEARVESIHILKTDADDVSYQGLTRIEAEVARRASTRTIPRGTLWIPADQPDFQVAAQLLEPDAADSLFYWGLLSTVTERKEYIASWVLEDEAAKLLEDPRIAAEWKRALGEKDFAADPRARFLWWYERTKYWDDTVNRMPVFRLLQPLAMDAFRSSAVAWHERDRHD